ncbi:MAG: RNA polymerase sigma-70 factor [Dinghuibacter sp.]|nr:RNA polymerase sigma-70 factor [Dinghuibacter sp.]
MSKFKKTNPDCPIDSLKYQIAMYEDTAAYKSLFFCIFPPLQQFAYAILRSRQLAEETASDVLMEVWVRRSKLMEIENLKYYLYTSVKNAALRKLKNEHRSAQVPIDELEVEIASEYATPEESCHTHELEQAIYQAVQQLPPRCKMIYKLAKEDKLRYAEIAGLLGVSVKTIDNQLSIALKKIATTIRGHRLKKS